MKNLLVVVATCYLGYQFYQTHDLIMLGLTVIAIAIDIAIFSSNK